MSLLSELQRRRKDNRLILGLVLAVLVVWAAVSVVEQRADEPTTITRGLLLFVLSYTNITLIVALLFVLGRTILKTWVERRRRILGSQFKTKLLVTYLGLTAIPIGLLFFTATGLLQRSIDRWFSSPVREVVGRARDVQDRAERRLIEEASDEARNAARLFGDEAPVDEDLETFRRDHRLETIEAYRGTQRIALAAETPAEVGVLPAETLRHAGATGEDVKIEVLRDGSHRYRGARASGPVIWVAGVRIGPAEAKSMEAIAAAWSEYKKLEVQKPAIKAANISTFLLITLAILFASAWIGQTLARRITLPIAALAESTRRLESGELSARVDVRAEDELGVLVESFNRMAAGLEDARDALLRSNEELQSSNLRVDLERRLLATVLESVTTGVLAFDGQGRVTVCNPAARALLSLGEDVRIETLRGRPELQALVDLLSEVQGGRLPAAPRELALHGPEGERRLEVAVRPLAPRAAGEPAGCVVAIEDTTHVAREQKLAAWSEVARRVAHEIKNPLTPIRLSAERIAKRFRAGEADVPQTIERGTRVIVEEVNFLKSLVDEFSRFARLPEMRPEPTDLPALAHSAVSLFEGAREGVRIRVENRLARNVVTVDPEQIRRALINLIDNAIEACGASGEILVGLSDGPAGVQLEVTDTGRGVAARDRDKLFLPDFTTKGRGTGLGLAIVSRIVADHNGTIRVEDNRPRGARFIIELPAA
ncbi:MAG TPA: ATP-binding protein [Thermoanaerobaculia bacterium]|nr:ATP-binding protein [Thermoanaerobaculia bacterium]